ncbi:MAG: DUF2513 domain-containing protein [Clostridium perfringens]|nr:DUF2513 domain-containing protein [Clostridium perfringens]
MKLNPDCIKDILIFVEENTDSINYFVNTCDIVDALSAYDENTICYHINKMDKANLFENVSRADGDIIISVDSLSLNGHKLLDIIHNEATGDKFKKYLFNL